MADQGQILQAIARIIARCWADEAEKKRFITNPSAVLAEEGVTVPPGVSFAVHADTQSQRNIVIPLPEGLTVEEIENKLRQQGYAAFSATFCA